MTRWDLTYFAAVVILAALLLVSILYGTAPIPLSDVVTAIALNSGLAEGDMSPLHRIVFELRLP